MSSMGHALYQITVKALIFDGTKVLVVETPDGYIDFPGGRVDESERNIPWTQALLREISEEIGSDIQIDIGETLFVSKRQYTKADQVHYVAALFFRCSYSAGTITLSDEHGKYYWVTVPELLSPGKRFMSDDELEQLKAYFSKHS